jgi:dipeptide transport system ATP-binding protein
LLAGFLLMPLLEIRNLRAWFGDFLAVDGLDLAVEPGEVVGVVGESGSGKSVSMLAVMGLIDPPGRIEADVLRFDGADLLALGARARRRLVGRDVAMVFQDPATALDPCYTVGWQIGESLRAHGVVPRSAGRRGVRDRVVELLLQVGIPAPQTRLGAYPHQLSGGMNQRVMIAMAIACNPRLLIADEPTTALDVTIQAQILALLARLQRERGMGLVLVTHDMGVVAQAAGRVQVMYAGQVMEARGTEALLTRPRHPYAVALLDALPERAAGRRLAAIPGLVPGPGDRGEGCLFAPRCRFAVGHCAAVRPALLTPREQVADAAAAVEAAGALPDRVGGGVQGQEAGRVRCHYPLDAAGLPTGHPGYLVAETA